MSLDEIKEAVYKNAWFRTGAIVAAIFLTGAGSAIFFADQFRALDVRLARVETRLDNLGGLDAVEIAVQVNARAIAVLQSRVDWLSRQQENEQ